MYSPYFPLQQNPARDLGPRIAAAMYGYPSTIWTDRNCYWIVSTPIQHTLSVPCSKLTGYCLSTFPPPVLLQYVPIIATITGGLIGSFVYDTFIFSGAESPLNKPFSLPWSKKKNQDDLVLSNAPQVQQA